MRSKLREKTEERLTVRDSDCRVNDEEENPDRNPWPLCSFLEGLKPSRGVVGRAKGQTGTRQEPDSLQGYKLALGGFS